MLDGVNADSGRVVLAPHCPADLLVWFAKRPNQVSDRRDRVSRQHARAGIAHHAADAVAHFRAVAVHRAFAAGGFIRLERAALNAPQGVSAQLLALRAELTFWLVPGAAVQPDHLGDGLLFLQDMLLVVGVLGFWHRPIIHERKERGTASFDLSF